MSITVNQEIAHEISFLSEWVDSSASSLDLNKTMILVTERLERVVPFDSCVFYLKDKTCKDVFPGRLITRNSEKLARVSTSLQEGNVVLDTPDDCTLNTSYQPDLYDVKEDFGVDYKCALCVPLKHGDSVLGELTLYNTKPDAYTDEHRCLLELVSHHAAKAIQNALIFEKNRDTAFFDDLTGLLNGRAFYVTLDQRIAECHRLGNSGRLTVLCIDVDNFTQVNETHGHLIGDKLLTEIAGAIQLQLRSMDTLARYSKDEFIAILPLASGETAQGISERIRIALETKTFDVGLSAPLHIHISVGTASYPTDGETSHQILATANRNMYRHKQTRKTSVHPDEKDNIAPIDGFS